MTHFILAATAASLLLTGNPAPDDNDSMRYEADEFVASMPDGLQNRQETAIRHALKGSYSELRLVRSSRNRAAPLSENVDTADLLIPAAGSLVRARFYQPADRSGRLPLLLYFHGGGWTIGSINSCAAFCNALASTGHVSVIAVDYALAPENPYPKALDQCVAILEWLRANASKFNTDAETISLGGDSSGGNLAIATALRSSHKPRSIVAFYPVVKAYDDNSRSWQEYGSSYGLDSRLMDAFNESYIRNGNDSLRYNPFVSPAHADDESLRSLPPMLMISAGRDILYDQGQEFFLRLKSLGADVKKHDFSQAVHLFITVPGQPAAFGKAVGLTAEFLQQ